MHVTIRSHAVGHGFSVEIPRRPAEDPAKVCHSFVFPDLDCARAFCAACFYSWALSFRPFVPGRDF